MDAPPQLRKNASLALLCCLLQGFTAAALQQAPELQPVLGLLPKQLRHWLQYGTEGATRRLGVSAQLQGLTAMTYCVVTPSASAVVILLFVSMASMACCCSLRGPAMILQVVRC
jgi:hypothetical protein